jgi:hypothetical protein
MRFATIEKVVEGTYAVSSLPCPKCNGVLNINIAGEQVFAYHQGASITEVLPTLNADDRERFITGLCGICWNSMFGGDDDVL